MLAILRIIWVLKLNGKRKSNRALNDASVVWKLEPNSGNPVGFGNNPDIGIGDAGQLLFKSRLNGEVFDTAFDIINYID